MNTMFDTLLQLPLFQGLAQDDFTNILEKVKLQFSKHKPGEVVLESGSTCQGLVFILKGEICATTASNDVPYSLDEYFSAPYLVEFSSLFGMNTSYIARYVACTEVHTVRIDKRYVLEELFRYDIFRLNCMNFLCNRAQVLSQRPWSFVGADLESRIVSFFLSLVERPQGEKVVRVKMRDLAELLNDTRANVSKTLNTMQEEGLIELSRGEIVVPAMERFI